MNLKDLRNKKGLSQSQLATSSGMNVRTLQNYEQGFRDINGCNIKTLINLSHALDCKVIDILDDEELIKMIKHAKFK